MGMNNNGNNNNRRLGAMRNKALWEMGSLERAGGKGSG